jgi:hypothetical protein
MDPTADAAPAADFAKSKRGIAVLARIPMIPHTKIMSIRANPCALRTVTSVALLYGPMVPELKAEAVPNQWRSAASLKSTVYGINPPSAR